MDDYIKINRDLWNKRTAIHKDSDFYDLEGFLSGNSSLNHIELEGLGPVDNKTLLHLQCHFGLDTLSWARLGANVTGVDLSEEALGLALEIAHKTNIPARFIQSDIYNIREVISESFDIVFTSYGTITWFPDLDKWAKVIAESLKIGGIFFIADFHPMLQMWDTSKKVIAYPYFNDGKIDEVIEHTYTDGPAINSREISWSHPLSEIIIALNNSGLGLLDFKEYDYSPYNCFENMSQRSPGQYVFGDFDIRYPHLYSMKWIKK
ncbi:MAG: class I SAM-dependent methyltransferase [Bacteroidia bacterium]|nr:class I SAM-dependent methyltransferase [Bacteroidia bacterium]